MAGGIYLEMSFNGPALNTSVFVIKDGFALTTKDHGFDPIKMSKLFQGLISRFTTSWADDDQIQWRCTVHWINLNRGGGGC